MKNAVRRMIAPLFLTLCCLVLLSAANHLPGGDFACLQKKYGLLCVPTYDGSFELTHPKALYFEQGWNGYRYWMCMTPYPHALDFYENPSIVVSNDGTVWDTPPGLKNPVSGIPADVLGGGHYSDPHLVMRGGTMELWYRYNPQLKQIVFRRRPDNSVNIYYRQHSTDGIHWSAKQPVLRGGDGLLSLCVLYENDRYRVWFATYRGELYSAQSPDAIQWSVRTQCSVPLPDGFEPYHQDLVPGDGGYYLLQTAFCREDYTFRLFLLTSRDGVRFRLVRQVLPGPDEALWRDVGVYRSSGLVLNGRLRLYLSLILPGGQWYLKETGLALPNEPL